ncbi:MAG: zinc-binding dehydrogenase [Tissierellales bacterium]|jgi:NADPH2:quinone reductase|nr:zinc-binding dehydrogenase [Tissierellales bacterium]
MYAQVIEHFGCAKVFEAKTLERPKPNSGEILIRVKATSLNPIDIKIRSGVVPSISPKLPAVLHGDVSGVVEEIGEGVAQFKLGDRVFGYIGGVKGTHGTLAEYTVADARLLAKIPEGVTFDEAALYPLVSLTAWEAIIERMQINSGDSILIHGGVGGVGHIAIQLAKMKGAKVYTTVSKDNRALANSFGADVAIDYSVMTPSEYKEIYTNDEGFDFVFDTIGGVHLEKSFEVVKPGGTIITTVARGNHNLSLVHRKALTLSAVFTCLPLLDNYSREKQGQHMRRIAELIEQSKLKVFRDKTQFTLEEISKAHEYMESRKHRGKISIII